MPLRGGTIAAPEQQRARILASIATIGNLRSGLVRKTHTKRGRPACHCMRADDPGLRPLLPARVQRRRPAHHPLGLRRTRSRAALRAGRVPAFSGDA